MWVSSVMATSGWGYPARISVRGSAVRPVRFVALSEDGSALVLTDEAGRMLMLPIDDAVVAAIRRDHGIPGQLPIEVDASLTPRDIQARIRSGESVTEVARIANVPVEKVLRFAGPVLQERAAMAQLARDTRLKSSDSNGTLGEVADARLREHGVDAESVAWDAFRKENGAWRITAAWQSGKATARAAWDLDKGRSSVNPVNDMAQFLSADRQALLAQDQPTKPRLPHPAFEDDESESREGPVVPALSMLRRDRDKQQHTVPKERASVPAPQRPPEPEVIPEPQPAEAPPAPAARTPLPSWDDILFGSRP